MVVHTNKTKAQLIKELEALRARVKSLEHAEVTHEPSSEYLCAAAENAPVGIGMYRHGVTLYVNQTYVRMTGHDNSTELVGKHFIDTIAPQYRAEITDRNTRRELGEDVLTSYETIGLRKDGTEFPVEVQATRIELPDGPATVGFFTDITERRQTEAIARQAEKKYRDIYENATEGIFQSTPQGTFLSVNPAMAHIHGYDTPEEMIAAVSDIAHQIYADPQARAEFARSLKEHGRIEGFETRGLRKDGSIIWTSCSAWTVCDENGAIAYYEGTLEDITVRKQAEEQLILLKLSVDASSDGAYWMDTEGRFIYVNEAGFKALGYGRDELLQMRVFDINPRVTPQRWAELWKQLREEGHFSGESIHRRKDGSLFPVEINSTYIQFEGREYCNGFAHDITERKRVQEELIASEERYRTLAEASHDMIFTIGKDGIVEYVNRYAADQFKLLPEAITGKNLADLFPGESGQRQRENIDRTLATDTPMYLEAPITFPGGERWVGTWLVPLKNKTGQVTSVMGVGRDITERKQAEDELFSSRQMLQTVLDNIPQRVFWKDRNSAYVGCNRSFALDCGYNDPSEMIGKTTYETASVTLADLYRADDQQVMETGRPKLNYEELQIRPNGSHAWLITSKVPLRDKDGQVIGVLGTYEDITERKRAEEALREKTDELDRFFSLSLDLLCIANVDGYFIRLNASWEKMLGYKLSDLEGKRFLDLVHPDDQESTLAAIATLAAGQDLVGFVNRYRCEDGSYRWIEWRSVPYQNRFIYAAARDITDRKQAEEALKQQRAFLRQVIDAVPAFVCVKTINGAFALANQALAEAYGTAIETLEGHGDSEFSPTPEEVEAFRRDDLKVITDQETLFIPEERITYADGSVHWLATTKIPLIDKNGSCTQLLAVAIDITERRRAEEALRESETIFSSFLEHSPVFVFFKDKDGRSLRLSRNYEQMLGVPLDQALGKSMDELFPSDLAKSMVADDLRILREARPVKVVEELNGRIYETTKFPILKDGKPYLLAGFTLDVTERKRAEEALRESEEKFRSIVETTSEWIWQLDTHGRCMYSNPAIEKILGYTPPELVGSLILEQMAPESRQEAEGRFPELIRDRQGWTGWVLGWKHKDGQLRWLESNATPILGADGQVLYYRGTDRDITDRRQVEEALRQYTARLETQHEIDQAILLAETPQAIAAAALGHLRELIPCQRGSVAIFDFEHDEVEILASHVSGKTQVGTGSKMPVRQYGVDEEILHGKVMLINDLASQPHLSKLRQILLGEGIRSIINVPLVAQGEPIGSLNLGAAEPAYFTGERIEIAHEVADQLAITIQHARLRERDQRHTEELEQRVTERTAELRAAYEQLQALSRVKDEFVSNVSHELRTPIASAKTYLHLLAKHPDRQEKYIETLGREVNRLEHLIEGLLILSRLDQKRVSTNLTTIDLNHLLGEYITDRTPLAENRNLALAFKPSADIPHIIGDRQLIGEVVSILLTNALNYTSGGGQVVIGTHMQESESEHWAGFSVSDSGWGISPGEQSLLFERFYRGKAARETQISGTGLGLAIAKEIIDLHCGRIEVHSDGIPGHGTRFDVWLPVEISA